MVLDEPRERVVVIGVGNERKSDDAVGVVAARKLQDRPMPDNVKITTTMPPVTNVLLHIEDAARVIIIIAAEFGGDAGTVRTMTLQGADEQLVDDTQPGRRTRVTDTLNIARLAGMDCDVRIIAVQPAELYPGLQLTEPVEDALPRIVSETRKLAEAQ